MSTAYLVRQYYEEGTLGTLIFVGRKFRTIELPWRDNQQNVSCIPEGDYYFRLDWSPKRKINVPELIDVPNRSDIQIHVANVAEDLLGCIGIGLFLLDDEFGVSASKTAFREFTALCGSDRHLIVITSNVRKPFAIVT